MMRPVDGARAVRLGRKWISMSSLHRWRCSVGSGGAISETGVRTRDLGLQTVRRRPKFSGQGNRNAGEGRRWLEQFSDWNPYGIHTILGVSATLLLCGTQEVEADGGGNQTTPSSAGSTVGGTAEVRLNEETLQKVDPDEVPSNAHTKQWRIYTDIGRDFVMKGHLDEAEKYFVRAMEEAKQGFGEKDPHVASSCNNLAELYRMKKEYGKAEPLFLEAVKRLENAFHPDHESVGFALHNLAGTYLLQRKFDQAQLCYERSLKIKERKLGANHPEFANTLFHLGEVRRLQGSLPEAEKLIRESIQILEDGGVGYSKQAVRRMSRLVEILSHSGQLNEAEKLQRKLLHILELSEGPESSNTIMAAEGLAGTLQAVGKLKEAEELLQGCFQVRQKNLGPNNVQLGMTMLKLASVSMQHGDELASKKSEDGRADAKVEYEAAEQLLHRSIRIALGNWQSVSSVKGPEGLRAGSLMYLLQSLDALGRVKLCKLELETSSEDAETSLKEAETLFRNCLSVLDKPEVSEELARIPGIQRQKASCLQHLADLHRSTNSNLESDNTRKTEVDQLGASQNT